MPNIAQILKNEILRLSRKEVKTATEHLTDTLKELKHQNALLKKEIAGLKEQLASVTGARTQKRLPAPSSARNGKGSAHPASGN